MPGLISLKSLAPVPRGRRAAACGTGQAAAWKNDGKSRESMTAQENAGIQSLGGVMKAATRASAQLASMTVFRAPAALVRLPEAAAASGGTTTTAVLLAEARAVTTTMTTTRGGKASEVKTYYSSSGSEHEPNSVCLAAMVHEFMEEEEEGADELLVGKCGRARCNCGIGSCSATNSHGEDENDDPVPKLGGEMREIFQGLVPCKTGLETSLLGEVLKAIDGLSLSESVQTTASSTTKEEEEEQDSSATKCSSPSPPPSPHVHLRRTVMKHLRDAGFNAGICKARWAHTGGFPGGDYEYIDVVMGIADGKSSGRILVDTDFRTQFEIARPTQQYKSLVQLLPTVFVGEAERLQSILNLMSDAIKRSVKKRGLDLPPWRKTEYIRAKWFSSYRRTTNEVSQSKTNPAETAAVHNFACIATRGKGCDSNFTNDMDLLLFQKTDSRPVMREMKNDVRSRRPTKGLNVKKQEEETGPEEALRRDVNPHYAKTDHDHHIIVKEIDNTAWQPPEVKPKAAERPPPFAGLSAIFKQSDLTRNKMSKV